MTNGARSLYKPTIEDSDPKIRETWLALDAKTKQIFKSFTISEKIDFLATWLGCGVVDGDSALLTEWNNFKNTYPDDISTQFDSTRSMMQKMIFEAIKVLETSDEKTELLNRYESLIIFVHPMSLPSVVAHRQLNRFLNAQQEIPLFDQPDELALGGGLDPVLLFGHGQMPYQPVPFNEEEPEFVLEDEQPLDAPQSQFRLVG